MRPRYALVYTGGAIGVFAYAVAVGGAVPSGFDNQKGWLMVPLAGPWLTLSLRRQTCLTDYPSSPDCAAYDSLFFVFDGLMQAAGLVLASVGLVATRRWAVPDHASITTVAPWHSARASGLSVVGSF